MIYKLLSIEFFLKCYVKEREYTNRILGPLRRLFLKSTDFTIISNNCWGGHVYRYFALPYQSPTIGLYLYAEDFVKLCSNLKYYVDKSSTMTFISCDKSKYKDDLKDHSINCPIGVIDDIEIIFLHYSSEKEAYIKWNRRCKRINWNHLVFKFCEQNLCTKRHLQDFDNLSINSPKFVFVSADYGLKSQVVFKEYLNRGFVSNDTPLFRKYINLPKFINGEEDFKLRQDFS